MKRILLTAAIALIALLSTAMPGLADEAGTPQAKEQQAGQKDECMLLAIKCGTSAISIQDKIGRLQDEIAKGTSVYTLQELNTLQKKLDEISRTLDFLLEKK